MKPTVYLKCNQKRYDKIYFETSALMDADIFHTFMNDSVIPSLKNGAKILIPEPVMRDLELIMYVNIMTSSFVPTAWERIISFAKQGYVEYVGDRDSVVSAEEFIISEVINSRIHNEKVLIITQNRDIASDVLLMNKIGSFQAPTCNVQKLNEKGELENFELCAQPRAINLTGGNPV